MSNDVDRIDYRGYECACGREIDGTTTDMPAKIEAGDCIDTITEQYADGQENVIGIRVIRHVE